MSEPAASAAVRVNIIFHGRVQGVGFRMTTAGIARGFRVTGWVRNLMDGTVELEAQGDRGEIERFLDSIAADFDGFIDRADRSTIATAAGEREFTIRH